MLSFINSPQPVDHGISLTEENDVTSTYQPPLLPPCRVCGEKASGFHYGVNTCEACKGFFRRSLCKKDEYRCNSEKQCVIKPGRRSSCAYCRYQKCINVGMSKQAIKTGRYTHQKKTKDIQEVKRLMNTKPEVQGHEEPELSVDAAELETTIQKITEIHCNLSPHTPEFFQLLPQREEQFLEKRKLKREIFGKMTPLPMNEYMEIYQRTGIDIDGRREMITHMIPCIEKAIKRFITFAKALPGFKELPIADQISLIKASRFEAWLISSHRAFNQQHRLFTHVCGYTLHFDTLAKTLKTEFLEWAFTIAGRIKTLGLTIQEECVFKALAVLSPDRCSPEQGYEVEKCQSFMLECLYKLIKKNHPLDRLMLPKLINILADLRTMSEIHYKQEETISMDWRDIKFPPLIIEMCA